MNPIAHKGLSRGALALRDLVFVMRENQVHAAAMNVKGFAQVLHAHGGAFDVPSGASRANLRFPEILALFFRFPEDEIARVFLVVLVRVDARSRLRAAEVGLAEPAVAGEVAMLK